MKKQSENSLCTSILNNISREAVLELLELAGTAPIKIISAPRSGLSVMHVLDAFDSEFLLGEVLVSSAEVVLNGQRFFAMVLGEDPERALARACTEALLQGNDELLKTRIRKLLIREQAQLAEQRSRENQLIANTKVNFELMAGN